MSAHPNAAPPESSRKPPLLSCGSEEHEAFFLAIDQGDAATVCALLPQPAAAPRDREGLSALMRAAKTGQSEILRVLLEAGFNPLLFDLNQRTALMHAVLADQPECVNILATVSSLESRDGSRNTALLIATERNRVDCARILLENGAQIGSLADRINCATIRARHPDLLRLMAERMDFRADRGEDGETHLMLAAMWGDLSSIGVFLPFSDPWQKDNDGLSAFDHSVQNGMHEAADALCEFAPPEALQAALLRAPQDAMPRTLALLEAETLRAAVQDAVAPDTPSAMHAGARKRL